ncbi:hypothetical protein KSS87_015467 [Heliosperma pusillum]|nr:hypothetical protein KSS87_015467 [Heliosperma pusillum]
MIGMKSRELLMTNCSELWFSASYAILLFAYVKALEESEEMNREAVRHREEIQEACTWYNRVLGFRIDGGHGVKFTFTYINRKCLSGEYSFTIRHANNVYTLIQCDPQWNEATESVKELNKSNDLYTFVRKMRDKFQAEASVMGGNKAHARLLSGQEKERKLKTLSGCNFKLLQLLFLFVIEGQKVQCNRYYYAYVSVDKLISCIDEWFWAFWSTDLKPFSVAFNLHYDH